MNTPNNYNCYSYYLDPYNSNITPFKQVLPTIGYIGSWLDAIGTVIAAIGSTPSKILSKKILEDLVFIGNAFQGIGSSLVADSPETLPNDRVGSALQSIGNLTVMQGLLNTDEETGRVTNKSGNLLQALGAGASINYDGEITSINNFGNGLQVLGNSLQAMALRDNVIETDEGLVLDMVGSWVQAVGTVISAITYEGAETGG